MSNLPEFSDYRRTDDGVMVGDIGFKKQLWALDPELDVVWDWGSAKWEIWKFPGQAKVKRKKVNPSAYHITTVETRGKTFRELGADIILKLQEGDTNRFTVKELIAYFDQIDENTQRAKRKRLEDAIWARSTEVAWFLHGSPYRTSVPKRFLEGTKFMLEGPTKDVKVTRAIGG